MSSILHCFSEPEGAELHFETSCNWAQTTASTLIDPVTIELGILLESSLGLLASLKVQFRLIILKLLGFANKLRLLPDDYKELMWRTMGPPGLEVPTLMFNEALSLNAIEGLVSNVPFPYVVAITYGRNTLPDEVVQTEYQSDSYGSESRLRDYQSRRWLVAKKFYRGNK